MVVKKTKKARSCLKIWQCMQNDPSHGKVLHSNPRGANIGQDPGLLLGSQIINHQVTGHVNYELPHWELSEYNAHWNLNLDSDGDFSRFPIVHERFLEA
ncbi:hypothetical protein SAY86_019230 [Trapa natans]|uniref:Uncharacterized protein n=1 Tax=Trapa natans TaxID=22666 RepID=A0AAN7QZL0_TRANT|nr:hypothetical protein SAY86_019230 [Trapa natans]